MALASSELSCVISELNTTFFDLLGNGEGKPEKLGADLPEPETRHLTRDQIDESIQRLIAGADFYDEFACDYFALVVIETFFLRPEGGNLPDVSQYEAALIAIHSAFLNLRSLHYLQLAPLIVKAWINEEPGVAVAREDLASLATERAQQIARALIEVMSSVHGTAHGEYLERALRENMDDHLNTIIAAIDVLIDEAKELAAAPEELALALESEGIDARAFHNDPLIPAPAQRVVWRLIPHIDNSDDVHVMGPTRFVDNPIDITWKQSER
jgi:hypothetical protein